jgi:hypothetical protein
MEKSRLSLFFAWQVVFLLSLASVGLANAKPVSVKNKAMGQLVTSSLLSWESFNEKDSHVQLEYAVYGGEFKNSVST